MCTRWAQETFLQPTIHHSPSYSELAAEIFDGITLGMKSTGLIPLLRYGLAEMNKLNTGAFRHGPITLFQSTGKLPVKHAIIYNLT